MNKREHIINAVLLSVGIGVLLNPRPSVEMVLSIVTVGVPVTLGALFPDIDTVFGTHRKTFHNLPVLLVFAGFPYLFGNLSFVWLGVLTHYILDLLGNIKGMALLYPYSGMFDIPVGVTVDSQWSGVVTLLVTIIELLAAWGVMWFNREILPTGPGVLLPGLGF